ncbi:MAG: YlxR family protein [Christensenellaceae bacterium]|jgi:predicted RNA-binding protein YlxR (DUF448 family)|nr:YlxR family protein [Christensenellaceae bacterium]
MRERKTPLRMCFVCKGMFPKSSLLRIVRQPDNTFSIDHTGKISGRGAYICTNSECLQKCVKKRLLNKSFKTQLPEEIYARIRQFAEIEN